MYNKKTFQLSSCLKHYTIDQDKFVDPLTTVKRAVGQLSKRYDLSHLKLEPRQDTIDGAYSYSGLSDQLHTSGKGLTPEQAQASAIMEFAERYSWMHFDYANYEGYIIKSYNDLKKDTPDLVNEKYFLNNFIHLRNYGSLLEEIKNIPLKWIKGLSLLDYKKFYYPINWHNYLFSSNGLAAGNAIEETILQAICEVIERENVCRLFMDKKVGNDLDPGSIKNPIIIRVLKNAKEKGIEFIIKDISFNFRIPTFIVQGTSIKDKGLMTYQGCGQGTHPNPEKALIRALSEYFEGFSLLKSRLKDVDMDWDELRPHMPKTHLGFLNLYNAGMLNQSKKTLKIKDLKDFSRNDIKKEIEELLKILKKHGHNVIFIDKTLPELNIPAVRIFIPEMRSIINTEFEDPSFIISLVAYEAKNYELSEKYLSRSMHKSLSHSPSSIKSIKPKKIFKEDFRENTIAFGELKKDIIKLAKSFKKPHQKL